MLITAPSRHRPHYRWATPLLMALSIGAFVWLSLGSDVMWQRTLLRWGALSANLGDWRSLLQSPRAATLITTIFLHASWTHLAGNMLFLMIFGLQTESAIRSLRFITLFIVGGALANLVAALLMAGPSQVIVGASGAVSTIIGAYLGLFPRAHLGLVLPLGLWLEFVRVPAALLIGLWALMQLLFTFVGPSFGAVAWWTHLTGFVVGLITALFLRPGLSRRQRVGFR